MKLRSLLVASTLLLPARAFGAHTFDLDQNMPSHLAGVWAVNWFGISQNDPQGPGGDSTYGNWLQTFPQCGLDDDPSTCADFHDAGRQRWIASKRRPLAGIHSSSARTAESIARIDLMLSCVRRSCDLGARLDAFLLQLDSVKFTSAHPQNQQSKTWDITYRAVVGFLDEADKAAMNGAVWIGNDATVYWHFGSSFGLTSQTQRKAALQDDIADMATLAAAHPSALSIDDKPFLAFYVDSVLMTPAEWQQVLDGARAQSGVDFYALATTLDASYFAAFDALSPWVNLGVWANAKGPTLHDRAFDYAKQMHAQLLAALQSNPGRVMFGGVAPGFDDFTENWGACQPRQIPRDPDVLAGQMDFLKTLQVRGVIAETWNDWTEGTELEPDVDEGPAKLLQLKQSLGALYGEPADPSGDQALADRWSSFGQARSCCFENGPCDAGQSPHIEIACPIESEPTGDDAGDPRKDAATSEAGAENEQLTTGCGCEFVGGASSATTGLSLISLILLGFLRRRKK